jgi:hypothetical protein
MSLLVAVEVLSLLILAVVLATTLAHALEFPGKMRLPKEAYLAVQPIYYPGFTIAGGAEPLGIIVLIVLAVLLDETEGSFWLALGALAALIVTHGLYWLVTHPVNNFWLKDFRLGKAGQGFFAFGAHGQDEDWTALRDRWEYSHLWRAVFAAIAFLLLAIAVALP